MNGERTTLFLCGIIIALVAALFHLFGYDPATATHSLFVWIFRRWGVHSATQDDFPYGWAAPFVSLWMVWRLRRHLTGAPKSVSFAGLVIVVLALAIHWLGARTQQPRISFIAFLLLIWSIPFFMWGWRVARMLIVPVGFLCFMLQFDFLSSVSLRLRDIQMSLAAVMLDGLGVSTQRVDAGIRIGTEVLGFVGTPGGLRSSMVLAFVAVLLAWTRQSGALRQLALLGSIPLIVLLAAIVRITTQGVMLANVAGASAATGRIYFDALFYAVAFSVLVLWHRALRSWKSNSPSAEVAT